MRASLFFKRILRDNRGATAIEYGLIAALIVIAMLAALQGFAQANTDMWTRVSGLIGDAVD